MIRARVVRPGSASGPRLVALAVLLTLPLWASTAAAVAVNCSGGGDAAGWAVASGGDFDGDGIADFAVGSPCARASGEKQAGRVRVYSGADGSRLLSLKGEKPNQHMGAALDFVGDLDGDQNDDLAVGSSGFPVPKDGGGEIAGAGKLEVFSSIDQSVIFEILGGREAENRGESVAGLSDVDGDNTPDFVVGGGGKYFDGESRGVAYVISGADGSTIFESAGEKRFDRWSSTVARAGDLNGDGKDDVLIGSGAADGGGVEETGMAKVFSGATPYGRIVRVVGAEGEKLGKALGPAGNVNKKKNDDFFVGAPGSDLGNAIKVGAVSLYASDGARLWTVNEPVPQVGAAFGTAVVSPGDLDDDQVDDVVAAAPLAGVDGTVEAGRAHALSGDDGEVALWTVSGTVPHARLGQSLARVPDMDDDNVADVLVGAPGDAAKGKRGAGTVRVLSGVDGSELRRFRGRRGIETRIFAAGLGGDRRPRVRSCNPFGRKRELHFKTLRGQRTGTLSLAVLDDGPNVGADEVLLAVGSGPGGRGPEVTVWRAGRRRSNISRPFDGIGSGYTGGVNVAAGELASEGDDVAAVDEIAVAQAESDTGDVEVVIWKRHIPDPFGRMPWTRVRSFQAFEADLIFEGLQVLVNAGGAYLAVANMEFPEPPAQGEPEVYDGDEIVAGPASGLPVVRLFDAEGVPLRMWLAYEPQAGAITNDGVHVAVGDLDGDGVSEIVTAPADGQPFVRAWNADGTIFMHEDNPVGILVDFALNYNGGARVAVADVDFDGRGEILTVAATAPGPGIPPAIKAFEIDGTPVAGWTDFLPFGPGSDVGVVITATDRFLKH